MKLKNIINYALIGGSLLLSVVACNKITDINVDPNNPEEVPASFLLTSGQKLSMENMWDEWANGRFGLIYSQYWSQQQYPQESRYQYDDSSINNQWITFYGAGGLKDLTESMKISEKIYTDNAQSSDVIKEAKNQYAAAQITRVWIFQLMTDIWGPIPYTESLKGNGGITPKYDSQKEIYNSLFLELDNAISLIQADASLQGDVIYAGDVSKWKKFAYSLKLRMALRIADADNNAKLQEILGDANLDLFTDNADNATLVFGSAPHNNPLNENQKTRNDFGASDTMIDTLKGANDPRIKLYFTENKDGNYVGVPYGLANSIDDIDAYSQPSWTVLYETAPGILMTFSEVSFALAEAAMRGVTTPSAADVHFADGVRSSMSFWDNQAKLAGLNIDISAEIDPYIGNLKTLSSANYKVEIGYEKWVALYMQGHQGWIEWRRLDFGLLRLPVAGNLVGDPGQIPVRRPYAIDEHTLNATQYANGTTLLVEERGYTTNAGSTDDLNTPVWWDKFFQTNVTPSGFTPVVSKAN